MIKILDKIKDFLKPKYYCPKCNKTSNILKIGKLVDFLVCNTCNHKQIVGISLYSPYLKYWMNGNL